MPDDELTSLDQYISRMKPKPDLSRSKSQGLKDKKHLEQSPFFFLQNPTEEGLWDMYNPLLRIRTYLWTLLNINKFHSLRISLLSSVQPTGFSTTSQSVLLINVLNTGFYLSDKANRWTFHRMQGEGDPEALKDDLKLEASKKPQSTPHDS
jgi:hypothetical protein